MKSKVAVKDLRTQLVWMKDLRTMNDILLAIQDTESHIEKFDLAEEGLVLLDGMRDN